jgi:hypothetical protein
MFKTRYNSGTGKSLTMRDEATLWDLEERFWTGELDSARATTAKDAVMIFPYPAGLLQGDRIWNRLKQGTRWRSVGMTDRRLMRRGALVVLAYRVSAEKADAPIYEALCASTYLHDEDRWLRISHQQTPVT